MEINDVLREFTRLCNRDFGLLQHNLAANSVLEWFGRTIRDHAAVYPYYRYDLCQQYEHCFEKAVQCTPIESKATHMQTKQLLSADLKSFAPLNLSTTSVSSECITPAQRSLTPTLPKVKRDKHFIPTANNHIPRDKTPSPTVLNTTTSATTTSHDGPLPKRFKYSDDTGGGDNTEISNEFDRTACLSDKKCDIDRIKTQEIGQGDCNIQTLPEESHNIASDTGYTDLMYLESIGVLLTRNKTKHRGITGIPTNTETPCPSPNTDLTTNSSWERKSKLKLSYRIRLRDNHILFALIIYEHVSRNPITRRNLLREFDETSDSDPSQSDKKTKSPQTISPQKKSLKRLRL